VESLPGTLIGTVAAVVATSWDDHFLWPLPASPQQPTMRVIGVPHPATAESITKPAPEYCEHPLGHSLPRGLTKAMHGGFPALARRSAAIVVAAKPCQRKIGSYGPLGVATTFGD